MNSPMTVEDFMDDDWKHVEAQLKVLPQGTARTLSPWHSARSPHLAGPPGSQCSGLSARHEDAGTDRVRVGEAEAVPQIQGVSLFRPLFSTHDWDACIRTSGRQMHV